MADAVQSQTAKLVGRLNSCNWHVFFSISLKYKCFWKECI